MDIEKFVQNIKFYCERKGVKPTVACKESGVGQSFINNMEARGSIPSVEKVQMLAQYLGVTVSDLLGEAPRPAPYKPKPREYPEELTFRSPPFIKLTVGEVQMIEAYRIADQRAKDMVDLALRPFLAIIKARDDAG